MQTKGALTLHTQLLFPLLPFVVDTFARALFLFGKVSWFEIPDLVTWLATYAFFCFGVMFSITPTSLPSDKEKNINTELVRQKLLAIAILSITFAGGISFMRAIAETYPSLKIVEDKSGILLACTIAFCGTTFYKIHANYIDYVNRI
ncbi:hypothetical protein FHS83_000269 [Rhizomicrobium palustre]|uniref:Uncharacterized protein n=1 Tax=Rhizomicrobium palustre TaxID=189966 RepID=A0A846MUT0_9PROT|nr:hypothetical protein [Rhizomicrobium palustre]NIK86951.1 hypothetical protein [Rhizomicrobium palustre]